MNDSAPIQDDGIGNVPIPIAKRRRRWFWPAALLLCLASAGASGGWLWHQRRNSPPLPPTLDLQGVDPMVIADLKKERQRVLQSPRSAAAWGRLGERLGAFAFRRNALECLDQAERLDPNELRWPYFQGVLLLQEHADEAIPYLRRAAQLCGDKNIVPRLRLSEALLSLDQLDEAEEGFRLVLQHDSRNGRAALGLGRIALQRGRWPQARSYLEAAVADRYCTREATRALAKLLQNLGDHDRATQLFLRVEHLPFDPQWPDPYVEEARSPRIGKRTRLVQIDRLNEEGRSQEAIALLKELAADYPDAVDVWYSLGQTLHRSGAYPQAERVMAKTVELAPGYAGAYNYLGAARLRQGKLAEAEIAFRKAIELKPDFAFAYLNLGRCLLQRKETAAAIDAFRTAISCKPEFVTARIELAELLHQIHRDGEALDAIRQALQVNAGDEQAKQLLAKLGPEPRP